MGVIVVIAVIAVALAVWGAIHLYTGRRATAPQPAPEPTPADLSRQYATERQAQLAAIARREGWTGAAFDPVLRGRIAAGMNQDMVLLAWGGPTAIDHRAVTPQGAKVERWIYRSPDGATQYIWFAEGRVVKIQG